MSHSFRNLYTLVQKCGNRTRPTIFLERTRKGHRFNQTNIGTVSQATMGKRLGDGMGFSERMDTHLEP